MSAIKQRKIARLLSSPPEHVTFVEADLLDADLEERLIRTRTTSTQRRC